MIVPFFRNRNIPFGATRQMCMLAACCLLSAGLFTLTGCQSRPSSADRPNILLIMSDNQSWNHVGAYGDTVVQTPNIDDIALHGAVFTHAFCAAPSCTPARAALLTGQDIYRLREGANLWGTLSPDFETYTDLLENNGYQVGYEGKGWGPGNFEAGGRKRNPAGDLYDSFSDFLQQNHNNGKAPWHYWFSSKHPHRPFPSEKKDNRIDSSLVRVPPYLPDVPEVRGDIVDYYGAIHDFDLEVKSLLDTLDKFGQTENTIIVICSDNGWQMPRGLANLYDAGTRIPLVIKWAGHVKKGKIVDKFVSLNDLAPTFLESAGIAIPDHMTAKSLRPLLLKGEQDPSRENYVVMARERHAFVRQHGLGYPARAIRTEEFLYIRNLEPDRWPAGDPPLFGDVDAHMLHYPSPTKVYLLQHQNSADIKPLFDLAFAKRPAEELYDLGKDPEQLQNVAGDQAYTSVKETLSAQLNDYLKKTEDPRVSEPKTLFWDTITYFQHRDFTPGPSQEAKLKLQLKDRYNYLE